jgi:hypothetical protein
MMLCCLETKYNPRRHQKVLRDHHGSPFIISIVDFDFSFCIKHVIVASGIPHPNDGNPIRRKSALLIL